MFREVNERRFEGIERFDECDLCLVDRPNVLMNLNELTTTVNTVVKNTCVEKYKYDVKAIDILLDSNSEYINYLVDSKKLRVDKRALYHFAAIFEAACRHYRFHFDNINKNLFDSVIKGMKEFIAEIKL